MIDQLPREIWENEVAEWLTAPDLCSIRRVSRRLKLLLVKFSSLKIPGTIRRITDATRRRSQTCPCCGAIFINLEKHYKNFLRHRVEPLPYRLPSDKVLFIRTAMDTACAHSQCTCSTPEFADLRLIHHPLMIDTIYGSFLIQGISFWRGGIEMGRPQFITNAHLPWDAKMPKIRIYKWKKHFWMAFEDAPCVIDRIQKIRLLL